MNDTTASLSSNENYNCDRYDFKLDEFIFEFEDESELLLKNETLSKNEQLIGLSMASSIYFCSVSLSHFHITYTNTPKYMKNSEKNY